MYFWLVGGTHPAGILSYLLNNGVFPKWNRISVNSAESGKLINHRSMNWAQFKDPVSHMCLAGTVVACWPLTQEVAGWQEFESFY